MPGSERDEILDGLRTQVEAAQSKFDLARKELSEACKVVPDIGHSSPDGSLMWERVTAQYRRAERAYEAAIQRFAETVRDPSFRRSRDTSSDGMWRIPPRTTDRTEVTKRLRQPEVFDPRTNRILALLDQADYDALLAEGEVVSLKFRKELNAQDEPVDAVYFPINSMVSLLVTNHGSPGLEMARIGNEGVTGASEALQMQPAMGVYLVQMPGAALRIKADDFRRILSGRPLFQRVIDQHLYALIRQILYGAACNHLHSMKARCARWLLMTQQGAGVDTFPLTQQFLSQMLGVRRATVNEATGILKKAGLIRYVRGKLTVVNAAGLESAACDCYQSIIDVYDSVLNGNPRQTEIVNLGQARASYLREFRSSHSSRSQRKCP